MSCFCRLFRESVTTSSKKVSGGALGPCHPRDVARTGLFFTSPSRTCTAARFLSDTMLQNAPSVVSDFSPFSGAEETRGAGVARSVGRVARPEAAGSAGRSLLPYPGRVCLPHLRPPGTQNGAGLTTTIPQYFGNAALWNKQDKKRKVTPWGKRAYFSSVWERRHWLYRKSHKMCQTMSSNCQVNEQARPQSTRSV